MYITYPLPLLPYHQKGEIKTMITNQTNSTTKILLNRKGAFTVTNDTKN